VSLCKSQDYDTFHGEAVIRSLLFTLLLVTACTPATPPPPTPQIIRIYASMATQPWLTEAYKCADQIGIILKNEYDPAQADIQIRMGEPENLASPAYQIGQDDLVIVTHPESTLQNLSQDEVQQLFSISGEPPNQVWAFSPGEDVQQIFTREILRERIITSFARISTNPQDMVNSINQDIRSVGVLPRRWKPDFLREVFALPSIPILVILSAEPRGPENDLISCLQR